MNGTYSRHRRKVEALLEGTDIKIDGDGPSDIEVRDPRFFKRVLTQGSLGLGESYMDGWWECAALDEMMTKLLRAGLDRTVVARVLALDLAEAVLFNLQSRTRAWIVGHKHYDIGNDLYRVMLDRNLVYSCGYWKNAETLDEAQIAKIDLVCRKLQLKPGMRVLDIGCGWGGAAAYVAEHYGCSVTGVTVSEEQYRYATEYCRDLPVEIRLQDYRDIRDTFDRVYSIGMFEHVGYRNYRRYMEVARTLLKEGGLFLVHTIGGNRSVKTTDPWINRYIFPNGMLPSVRQIGAAIDGLFVMEDWHNFGPHYDTTLMHWFRNFDGAWPRLAQDYGERFYRMWKYYLLSCAASFRARKNQLWQVVLSVGGVPGGYEAPR
ncbi:MAG: cyclopropane fatty acyl phospholipid synthase [Alkalispirochaeta sp.]